MLEDTDKTFAQKLLCMRLYVWMKGVIEGPLLLYFSGYKSSKNC